MALTFLLGGARSGKSALAVELGRRHDGPVAYIATAPRLDDDMRARIERHRHERPSEWSTVEEQQDLVAAILRAGDAMAIVDCLTLWTSNLLAAGDDDVTIERSSRRAAELAAGRRAPTVVISNEVGLGVHPPTKLGRRYRDVLGRVNQQWSAVADASLLLVAGRAVPLSDPLLHL